MVMSVESAFGRGVFFGRGDVVIIGMGVVGGIAGESLTAARVVVGITGVGVGAAVAFGISGRLMHPAVKRTPKQRKKRTIAV